jgi:DNA modification methylase
MINQTDVAGASMHPIVIPSLRPFHVCDSATIYNADCLEVLGHVSLPSFDAVITDPPYMIGISSVGDPNSKSGTWADVMNAASWFAEWYGESWKLVKPTGFMASFCNWRSLPCVMRGLAMRFIPVTSCVVWHKQWIGPGYKNAFRPTYELIVISAKPEAEISDRSQSDVMEHKWMASQSGSYHAAEKPQPLMERLIQHLTPDGGTILDPFMGSGTTLVAAKTVGRKAVGIEIEPRHCETAVKRLSQGVLF